MKKQNKYVPNNKPPIPAMHENPRYTGKCKQDGPCKHCKGEK